MQTETQTKRLKLLKGLIKETLLFAVQDAGLFELPKKNKSAREKKLTAKNKCLNLLLKLTITFLKF